MKVPSAPPMFLQGGVEKVEKVPSMPAQCARINGFGSYQQAWFALGQRQYQIAADYFQIAGDQMEASAGETKFLAEARFAEAQSRRLMGQYDRSRDLYKRAIAVFENCEPNSYYLRAAKEALRELSPVLDKSKSSPIKGLVQKKETTILKAMAIPGIEKVSSDVPLSSKVTQLDNGVSINALHDGDFFNRSRGTLPQTAAVDISNEYVKEAVRKAVLKMNCQETAEIGATIYSAQLFYKPITSAGKTVAVGAGSDLLCPMAELKLNGKVYKVPMDLPHVSANSRNVLLVTDDRHVVAIDPRTSEAWKLNANFSKRVPDFSWSKLGKQKGRKFS
ncbi:MAG: tetratricopeptide repeat protein [Candidatus Obscuribacterales bacterium]|nr:tetratricopeptide repeat protein [Candidatus Obscuribacterales bacterium]